jgi:hypothetical protein
VATIGVISGALVALGGFWSLRSNVERASVAAFNAVAEDGSAVHEVRILVDGVERCASSPCSVTGLTRGSHLARVVAPGYVPTAARAFTVQAGDPANVSFELVRVPPPQQERVAAASEQASIAAPAAPLAEAPAAAEPMPAETPSAAADGAERATTAPKRASAPKAKQSSAPKVTKSAAANIKPAGQATLSFQSAPRANVVLDGRPIGKTPLAGVSVAAGMHNIVFIGADGRRKAQVATVTAGSKRAIVAKF